MVRGDASSDLDALLHPDADRALLDAVSALDRAAFGRESRIVLHGAGGLGRRAIVGLRHAGVEPLAICDNAVARQGSEVDGLTVLSPADAAARFGADAVFVVTIWGAGSTHRFAHSRAQLQALGCDVVVPFPLLFWKYPAHTLPHYLQDLPHKVLLDRAAVRRGLDLWEDDASRNEYVSQVRLRVTADFDQLAHPVHHPQYFADDLFEWRADEFFVDGGAYDGDTLRSILDLHGCNFARVLAVEPDLANFLRLEALVDSLAADCRKKVDTSRVALGSKKGILFLDALGSAASATSAASKSGSSVVDADTLDTLLAGARPTMIKLDIEGAEPEALQGARESITRDAPILAVSVYHRQDHLWRIPLMIHEWRSDYALFLRPHNEEGWDLICYAIPRARLRLTSVAP